MWLSQTAVCCPHEAVLFKKHEGDDAMAEMMVVATWLRGSGSFGRVVGSTTTMSSLYLPSSASRSCDLVLRSRVPSVPITIKSYYPRSYDSVPPPPPPRVVAMTTIWLLRARACTHDGDR